MLNGLLNRFAHVQVFVDVASALALHIMQDEDTKQPIS